jgi:hypothetical protein
VKRKKKLTDPYTTFLTTFGAGLVYAFLGMFQAFAQNEPFDGASFLKTVLLSLVSGGIISTQTSDLASAAAVQFGIVVSLDKAINAIRKSFQKTIPAPAAPATATAAKTQISPGATLGRWNVSARLHVMKSFR